MLEPGQCQVDLWVTRFDPGAGYANATPTCTLTSLPRLEWGAQFQHFWFSDREATDQILGPNLKVNFVPEDKGVGVGLYFNSGVNLRTGDLEVATLLVPVTIPVSDHVRLNLNAGWQYLRLASIPDAFFWGAQVEAKVGIGGLDHGRDVRARARCSRAPSWACGGVPMTGRSISTSSWEAPSTRCSRESSSTG